MQKLPIGIQTFSEIRNENYLYIDKTEEAYNLITTYKYVFLSRPRRFGKSLFLDTLHNIFEGNKELFKGLYIYDKYDFENKYPVIKISFNSGDFSTSSSFQKALHIILDKNERNLGVPPHAELNSVGRFKRLIEEVYIKYQKNVVILVDEYDKPILNNIENAKKRKKRRKELKSFYEVIKDSDMYIRFAFLTGISKFSKVNIFSGLNNIEDITLTPAYGNVCGYTQYNIENEFSEYLQGVDLVKLKEWYNGYNFLKDNVYNPFDILLFIRNNFVYKNYWFETGTPSFLIKLIKEKNYYLPNLEKIILGEEILQSFNIDKIKLEVLLYQTGYLTIDKMMEKLRGGIKYSLKIPNKEVQMSLNDIILAMFTDNSSEVGELQDDIYLAFQNSDLEAVKLSLKSLFASIPYNNFAKNNINIYEGFYASVVYVYLASLGLPLQAENPTNKGRLDLSLEIDNKIYIIEFKMGDQNALAQIKEKKYYEKFLDKNKEIYLVGINFSEEEKNLSNFEWEKLL